MLSVAVAIDPHVTALRYVCTSGFVDDVMFSYGGSRIFPNSDRTRQAEQPRFQPNVAQRRRPEVLIVSCEPGQSLLSAIALFHLFISKI